MSIMDMDAFTAAFNSHKAGSTKFTRRMVITLAHMDGSTPKQAVLRCERLGLLKAGIVGLVRGQRRHHPGSHS